MNRNHTINHSYVYQTPGDSQTPNRFWFTPDQIARCCLEYGRAKDSKRTVSGVAIDGLVITVTLTKALIERSCRADVAAFHGNANNGSTERYIHADDGSLTIEIQE